MSDLFKKLNVLIRSGLSDTVRSEGKKRQPLRLGKDLEREVHALRERINDAVAHEDRLKEQLRALADEIAQWDQQADAAVAAGDDDAARGVIDKMRQAKRRYARVETDLQQHEVVTQDLIQRVNQLDAVVADARRAQQPAEPEAAPLTAMSNVLREACETIASLGERIAAQPSETPVTPPTAPADEGTVDDDLIQRRQRLSRR